QIGDPVVQPGRAGLPGHAETVLEPAARAVAAAALDQLVPEVVDLGLVGTADLEGDRLGEGELRSAVERDELLAVGRELDGEDAPLRPRTGRGVPGDPAEVGVLEHGDVEVRGLLGASVEPQAGGEAVGGHEYLQCVERCRGYRGCRG